MFSRCRMALKPLAMLAFPQWLSHITIAFENSLGTALPHSPITLIGSTDANWALTQSKRGWPGLRHIALEQC